MRVVTIVFTDDAVLQIIGDPIFDAQEKVLIVDQGEGNHATFNWNRIAMFYIRPKTDEDADDTDE